MPAKTHGPRSSASSPPAGTSAWRPAPRCATIDECVAESARDVTVQTALLESRLVCGPRRLFQALHKRLAADTRPARLPARQDAGDAAAPHQVRGHAVLAGTQLQGKPGRPARPAGADLGGACRRPGPHLDANWPPRAWSRPSKPSSCTQRGHSSKLIRARLHMVAGRREDRLVFDLQTAVAQSFGLAAAEGQRVSEVLMHRYYWAAKAVAQLNQILLLNIEERIEGREAETDAADQRALPRPRRHARSGQRRSVPARTARDPRDLPASSSRRPASRACRRAPCVRCTTRAR